MSRISCIANPAALLLILSVSPFLLFAAAPEDDVTIRSDVTLVRVDAQVLDRSNRAVTGLRAQDFVLLEEGKKVDIRNFAREEMPVDILFLLDVSGSMQTHIQTLATAAHQALGVLTEQDRVAIMVFDRQTRVRMPFRSNPPGSASEFDNVLRQEHFNGGTDITRGLLDSIAYMSKNGRRDARRAIVILTDDETEKDRDEARVESALARANTVLMALLAPNMASYRRGGGGGGYPQGGQRGGGYPQGGGRQPRRGGMGGGGLPGIILGGGGIGGNRQPGGGYPGGGGGYPQGGGGYPQGGGNGPVVIGNGRTHTAGTAEIARQSGGDSMPVDSASALEDTLQRIRQRYALYFYLPQGAKPGQERNIEVTLSADARRRYSDADVRYRQQYLAPGPGGATTDNTDAEPVNVSEERPSPRGGVDRGSSTSDSDDSDTGLRRRRRPAVDDTGGSRGPMTSAPESTGGWKKASDATTSVPSEPKVPAQPSVGQSPSTPAEPADPKGGWRRVKPGEQP